MDIWNLESLGGRGKYSIGNTDADRYERARSGVTYLLSLPLDYEFNDPILCPAVPRIQIANKTTPDPSVEKYVEYTNDLIGAIYLAYLDSLGVYASEDTREFNDFYSEYLGNSSYRRNVGSAVREHLGSAEYLGPNLTAVLRIERLSLEHRVGVIGNVEEAIIRATVTPWWLADTLVASKPRDIELELWSIFKGKTTEWLNSSSIPNPWFMD